MFDLQNAVNSFPISGGHVELRIFTKENITDEYIGWLNDADVVRYSNQRFTQHTRKSSLDYLQTFSNTENIFLAVYLTDETRYVGTMRVHFSAAHQVADIGIMIGDKACWGRGVGGDAWLTLLNWLVDVAGIRKVTGGTLRCNSGMVKIMVNSGMNPDGVRIAQNIVDGQAHDAMFFSKFQPDRF
jgi:ribosomal-protein-alanine N-acetyltransferase